MQGLTSNLILAIQVILNFLTQVTQVTPLLQTEIVEIATQVAKRVQVQKLVSMVIQNRAVEVMLVLT